MYVCTPCTHMYRDPSSTHLYSMYVHPVHTCTGAPILHICTVCMYTLYTHVQGPLFNTFVHMHTLYTHVQGLLFNTFVRTYVHTHICLQLGEFLLVSSMSHYHNSSVMVDARAVRLQYLYSKVFVIGHLYNPTYSLIRPSYEVQSLYKSILRVTP